MNMNSALILVLSWCLIIWSHMAAITVPCSQVIHSKLPGGSHHDDEIHVSVNGRAHPGIVVHELLRGHLQCKSQGKKKKKLCFSPFQLRHISRTCKWEGNFSQVDFLVTPLRNRSRKREKMRLGMAMREWPRRIKEESLENFQTNLNGKWDAGLVFL